MNLAPTPYGGQMRESQNLVRYTDKYAWWSIKLNVEKWKIEKKNSLEPDLNQWPMDVCYKFANYSPPLYQLSYRGGFMLVLDFAVSYIALSGRPHPPG